LNLLVRINRELGGNFVLPQLEHAPRFNESARSIEMHIRSKRAQRVRVEKAGDVIPVHIGETVIAAVDGVPVMECRFGASSGQYALQVTKLMDHGRGEDAAPALPARLPARQLK